MRRRLVLTALVLGLVATASGCGKSAADFKKAAERAIAGADTARVIGEEFTGVYCEAPSGTARGSTFSCAAKGKDSGANYRFTATITRSNRVDITDYQKVESEQKQP